MERKSTHLGRRFLMMAVWWIALALFATDSSFLPAQPDKAKDGPDGKDGPGKEAKAKDPPVKLGLLVNDPKALQGYTLMSPLKSKKTYLLDMQGKVAKTWEGAANPALMPTLLENGNLLRPTEANSDAKKKFEGPAMGGRVQEFNWNGDIVWDFTFINEKQLPHHDVTRLPNGNIIMVVWDYRTKEEAIAAGRRPTAIRSHLQPDSLVEIKPTGKMTGEVVWEWKLWDHLVQDFDETKPNFGKIAEHPELVDINFGQDVVGQFAAKKDGQEKLKGIGYVGNNAPKGKGAGGNPDWTHVNGVAYNPDLDQLCISIHAFSEFWIIDHSTTTAEAATHKGGKSGKGGDLLFRWGNPRAYAMGNRNDQRLFAQHNAHWIPKGYPGEGHILVFNNGGNRSDGSGTYSSVDELVLPVDAEGRCSIKSGSAFGPDKAVWSYSAPKKSDFYSSFISGAQRLPNGHTLICSGANGTIFEVTSEKEIVWKYINPLKDGPDGKGGGKGPGKDGKGPDGKGSGGKGPDGKGFFGKGPGGFGDAMRPGQILPGPVQDALKLSDDQKKQVDDAQMDVTVKLDKILTEPQNKEFKELKPGFGADGFGVPPPPGTVLSDFLQAKLKLADDQKKGVVDLQKDTDRKLATILAEEQMKQLKGMQGGPGQFGFGGPGGGSPGGGPPGGGPPGGGSLFRAYRFAVNYPGLQGRDLTATKTLEELLPMPKEKEPKGKQVNAPK